MAKADLFFIIISPC